MERPNAVALGVLAFCIVGLLFAAVLGITLASRGDPPSDPSPTTSPTQRPSAPRSAKPQLPLDFEDFESPSRITWKQVVKAFTVIADLLAACAVAVWVSRDSSDRGHDGAVWGFVFFSPHVLLSFWPLIAGIAGTLLVTDLYFPLLFAGWVTLPVYLLSRRRGALALCGTCPNHRLAYALFCPHCGRKADH